MINFKFNVGDKVKTCDPCAESSMGRVIAHVHEDGRDFYKMFWLDQNTPDIAQFQLTDKDVLECFYEKASN